MSAHVSHPITVVRSVGELRSVVGGWRHTGQTIALVPTMGALHAGHISLVELARKKARRTVVSIFVNPTQFAPSEDLARYPRDEAGDLAKLGQAGADMVWSPDVGEMYPDGFSTGVTPGSAAKDLEGAFRPHHFAGVATVCAKLFNQVAPDWAIFGEKDYQQLAVLRQMVRDLDMPLELVAAPTKREPDGLALSSRNAYLSADERRAAPVLYAAIQKVAADIRAGHDAASSLEKAIATVLQAGFGKIDYIEVRDAETLAIPDERAGSPLRVLAAVWLGRTRLIDNLAV